MSASIQLGTQIIAPDFQVGVPSPGKLTEKDYLAKVSHFPFLSLRLVPIQFHTERVCFAAVTFSYTNIKHVTDQRLDICKAAIAINPRALRLIRKEMQHPSLCMLAISSCGAAIRYVHNPTRLMCMLAVMRCGYAINFIPKEMVTQQMKIVAESEPQDGIEEYNIVRYGDDVYDDRDGNSEREADECETGCCATRHADKYGGDILLSSDSDSE